MVGWRLTEVVYTYVCVHMICKVRSDTPSADQPDHCLARSLAREQNGQSSDCIQVSPDFKLQTLHFADLLVKKRDVRAEQGGTNKDQTEALYISIQVWTEK